MSTPGGPRLGGTIPAVVTPFGRAGSEVDLEALDRHVAWLHARGVRCIAPMGTNGEGPSLSMDERRRIIDRLAAHPSGMAFAPGTGCTALPETIELSRHALERGAPAVLVAPPSFFPATQRGVACYYERLLEALGEQARVVLYHVPRYTGVPIEPATVTRLRDAFGERVCGVKDSGGELAYSRTLAASDPQLTILSGSDATVAAAYRQGAQGVVSALANFVPERVEAVRRAVAAGEGGEDEQRRLSALRELTHAYPQRAALKVLVGEVTGSAAAAVRPPLVDLEEADAAALRSAFAALR